MTSSDEMTALERALEQLNIRVDPNAIAPAAHTCPTCDGMGYVQRPVKYGHPDFGKLYECPDPGCTKRIQHQRERAKKLMRAAAIPESYLSYSFATWTDQLPATARAGKEIALAVGQFVATRPTSAFLLTEALTGSGIPYKLHEADINSDREDDWYERLTIGNRVIRNSYGSSLVLSGDYGTGKTGLTVAIANALIEQGLAVVYIRLPNWIKEIQATYGAGDGDDLLARLTAPMRDADVVIVDECNVEDITPHKRTLLADYIIQPRWERRPGKPIILTTNLTAAEFEQQWGGLIATRVFEIAHWINLSGMRLRPLNKPV